MRGERADCWPPAPTSASPARDGSVSPVRRSRARSDPVDEAGRGRVGTLRSKAVTAWRRRRPRPRAEADGWGAAARVGHPDRVMSAPPRRGDIPAAPDDGWASKDGSMRAQDRHDRRDGGSAMTEAASSSDGERVRGRQRRLALLLAAAMFVLVVDTSLMNVSIAAVVRDLGTTASGVQSAIALEALVSAAFILIGGKVGDLIGRKRAYALGLLGYAVGALAMALAQGLTAVIIFWAVLGGIGASLLLPAMQSLIHGNFEGSAQKQVYALVGAAAAIAAAVGPLLGGFITTYLSWRVGFVLEVAIIAVVLSGITLVRDVPYTGPRSIDVVGALLSVLGMGGLVLGILVWQEGGESVAGLLVTGVIAMAALVYWLVRRKHAGKAPLIDPDLFGSALFRFGISQQMLQQIALGGVMIALPIYLQMVLEYNAMQAGLSLAPLSLSMFAVAVLAGKKSGRRRPSSIVRLGFVLLTVGVAVLIPIVPRAEFGWALIVPLVIAGSGLGLLVSQLNNYTLSPISDERVSEAAGVNSAAGSFGLSFGLAFAGAIMLATLSSTFTTLAQESTVLPAAEKQQVAQVLEENAQLMTNTQLEQLVVGQPPEIEDEILGINTEARPIALQVALLIPLLAGLIGLFNSFRMMRLPDPTPSGSEGVALG
ncbi:MFS transporter [Pseudonocardia sp. DLS-67]